MSQVQIGRTVPPVQPVQLCRQAPAPENDEHIAFYTLVRQATDALAFQNYSNFIRSVFCDSPGELTECLSRAFAERSQELSSGELCFTGNAAYDQLREATDLFVGCQAALLEDCCPKSEVVETKREKLAKGKTVHGSSTTAFAPWRFTCYDTNEINRRFAPGSLTLEQLKCLASRLFNPVGEPGQCCEEEPKAKKSTSSESDQLANVITFMRQLRGNQADVPLKDCALGSGNCFGLLLCKLRCPPMLELIWSYWMEQGMLVQGINALSLRFQNRRPVGRDPLTRCDISPLRPLNNILWGYMQRESDRLSVVRRAYEYDHHYGLRLDGRAIAPMVPADSRTQFIEAFHRLLSEAARYFRVAMDTTMNADAFPVLHCLREVHLLLAEGAHNQFGDLPTTARAEMLMQQWILARPEVREFLGGRPGVPYPETWMPHVETLRQMFGWADTTIRHYRDLAVFGEQLLLSIRYLPWSIVNDSVVAAGWLTFWRPEIQAYVHGYRAVTGVDLSADNVRLVQSGLAAQPSDLIRRRRTIMASQSG